MVKKDLETKLRQRGYDFVEADLMINNGYASAAVRHYGAAVVKSVIRNPYGLGDQLAVRINLAKVAQEQQKVS